MDTPDNHPSGQPLDLVSTEGLGPLVEQAGWAVEMHGQCVLFANNAEKASGRSPGAKTRVFTERQVLEMLAAERERCAKLCESMESWGGSVTLACAAAIRKA